MARPLVQLALAEHGRVDVQVAVAAFQFVDEVFERLAHRGSRGQPEGQARADQRMGVEQVELAAEPAMVVHDGALRNLSENEGERPAIPGRSPGEHGNQRAGNGSGVVVTKTKARCMKVILARR
ncbi:hypothetical protein ACFXJ8_23170 [Nonomuraea sp. NPDC059194]|uniref:hypothetical protein n=1 Tax=Nonomuraea sp. NPDC059194 TaxID=3346764 RepID=UPI00368A4107